MTVNFLYRRSIRLPGYDYSQAGWYFVTICSYKHECIFGEIVNGEMKLNEIGENIKNEWANLSKRFSVNLDQFQIMPNHLHGIIIINDPVGVSFMKPVNCVKPEINIEILKSNRHMGLINQTPTIGQIIRHFKSKCSYKIHLHELNQIIWQRNYFEHVIRNDADLNRIREYIQTNPMNWKKDKLFTS